MPDVIINRNEFCPDAYFVLDGADHKQSTGLKDRMLLAAQLCFINLKKTFSLLLLFININQLRMKDGVILCPT